MKKNASSQINVTPLLQTAARTATANGTAKNLGASLPQTLMAVLDSAAGTGTTPTLDVKVQGSNDGTTWVDTGAVFTQVVAVASFQRKDVGQPVYKQYRAVSTIGGTTPSFTYSVHLIGANPTYAPVTQVD